MPEPSTLELPPQTVVTATIPAGEYLSNAIDLSLATAIFIFMPQAWTPAMLSFQISYNNTDFYDLFDESAREITMNISPATAMRNPAIPAQAGWLRFRSGSRLSPIKQTGDRTIVISFG